MVNLFWTYMIRLMNTSLLVAVFMLAHAAEGTTSRSSDNQDKIFHTNPRLVSATAHVRAKQLKKQIAAARGVSADRIVDSYRQQQKIKP